MKILDIKYQFFIQNKDDKVFLHLTSLLQHQVQMLDLIK